MSYRDTNYPDRAGWKEVIAQHGPEIVFIESSAPETDRSRQLADYPADLLNNPPQDVEARITFARERRMVAAPAAPANPRPTSSEAPRAGSASEAKISLEPNRQAMRRDRFTELITTAPMSAGVVLMALAVAAGLGAFHALEPGHGKTMVAAYLVGSRGTARHALLLGLIVTASHTAGVYLLGMVTLYASRYIVPERIYPWLGVISGVTIAGLGLYLFSRRYAGVEEHHHHHHDHEHFHPHSHQHDHGHEHGHRHSHAPAAVSLKELFTLGVTGGIVPCPAALVVLLGALSLGRVGFGLILIVAFSIGLAAVLIITGLLVVYARRMMARARGNGRLITRWLPLTSSAVITVLGLAIAAQGLQAAGLLHIRLS